jgi:hypothetical protein
VFLILYELWIQEGLGLQEPARRVGIGQDQGVAERIVRDTGNISRRVELVTDRADGVGMRGNRGCDDQCCRDEEPRRKGNAAADIPAPATSVVASLTVKLRYDGNRAPPNSCRSEGYAV